MKLISDTIAEQVFRITQSQLILPWTTYGIGELTKAISERVQHHFIVDENQNSHTYSQREMIHHSQQQQKSTNRNKSEIFDDKAKKYIKVVKSDQPTNLSDMIGLAAENNFDIKLVYDVNYESTQEDKEKGTYFQLMSGDGTVIDIPSETNNYGYAVIQKILKDRGIDKSIEDLHHERAQNIIDTPE
ncbi:unnamed protein product [Rotaria sp. Silwood2]|nr:unnamed protein product [Rotaria sp. Silwood2]CAF3366506.1 unnamed protein product [Rotaria sp. Silwood2]CAF4329690.1 unnamed protein product [Rotaria sp. Silwood2]CAF4332002.1 unnamed protein product [Rotaria sp. Silwood2]CAF4425748.1 unnamed protein product [Rotaria sp. Silwood2]